jgi:hypothetical protein
MVRGKYGAGVQRALLQHNKSFLRRFFSKKAAACLLRLGGGGD